MQAKEVEALISELAEPLVTAAGMSLVDVEYVREKDWYLRIFIDKPGGVEIDDCQLVSEQLTEILDARDPIPEKYFLEVSSPGIDRPLKKDGDFLAAYGTKIDLVFNAPYEGAQTLVGVLEKHDADALWVRRIVKGREEKNAVRIERKLLALARPHLDF